MNFDRFDLLYERYCDGALTPEERSEFVAFMDDPACRARFVELSAFEAAVSDEARVSEERKLADISTWLDEPVTPRRLAAVRLPRRVRLPRSAGAVPGWKVGAIAAGLLLGFVLILAVGTSGPPPRPLPERRPPVPMVADAPAPVPVPVAAPAAPQPPRAPEILPEPKPAPAPEVRVPAPPAPVLAPRKPAPVPAPKPEAPPAPREVETTTAFIAQLERVHGDVQVLVQEKPVPAEPGKGLLSGNGLRSGRGGYALVKFGDGTRLEVGAETLVARLSEGPQSGKSVQLEQGIVAVDAARQPQNRPMALAAPHAEAMVLGTQFTLQATAAFTRLDVREGKVRFSRQAGGSSATVAAGQYAIAGAGHELAARPAPPLWKAPGGGLLVWLKADGRVQMGPSGVGVWPDASGTGNHASQPSPASQPALVPNAIAGKPALRFDGADDFLVLPGAFNDFRQGLSAFVVARVSPAATWVRFLDFGQGPCANNIFFGRKDAATQLGFWVYANGVTVAKVNGPGGLLPDQFQTASVVLGPQGRATLYRNGQEVGAGVTSEPTTATRRPSAIGKSNYDPADPFFKGEIAEVLLYNRAVSDAERVSIDGYLHAKYFDPTASPASLRPPDVK